MLVVCAFGGLLVTRQGFYRNILQEGFNQLMY